MSEKLNTSVAPGEFSSLETVEFAGDKPEANGAGENQKYESLPLEKKVQRLRGPLEADEAVKASNQETIAQGKDNIIKGNGEIESLTESLSALRGQLSQLSEQPVQKQGISKFFKGLFKRDKNESPNLDDQRSKIEEEIANIEKRVQEVHSSISAAEQSIKRAESSPDYETEPKPLSVGEKEELLSFDALSELSLDEYAALWRRLNPFYAAHVTRQGIRDHIGMVYHSGGKGEFHGGFTNTLDTDKGLVSPAELQCGIKEGFTEEDVSRLLESDFQANLGLIDEAMREGQPLERIALEWIGSLMLNNSNGSNEPWSDKMAIHFTRNICLDDYYGAEKGNEVFYVYPIDVIASQARFTNVDEGGFPVAQIAEEKKWNDFLVFPDSGKLPLDAGIVFLPKSTLVSPKTGSVYELTETVAEDGKESRNPVVDETVVDSLVDAIKALGPSIDDKDSFYTLSSGEGKAQFLTKLREEFHLPEDLIECIDTSLLYSSGNFLSLDAHLKGESAKSEAKKEGLDFDQLSDDEKLRLSAKYALLDKMVGLKKAENPITAEEFWNRYFDEHPDKKPKHIVFYDGDPSTAVDKFLEEHHIATPTSFDRSKTNDKPSMTGPGDTHASDGALLGFDSHLIAEPGQEPQFVNEHNRFNEIAKEKALEMLRAYQEHLKQDNQ